MRKGVWRYILVGAIVLVGVLVGSLFTGYFGWRTSGNNEIAGTGHGFALAPPAFGQTVSKSFLEQEAGISLYVNVGQEINLAKVKPLFAVLEDETGTYLIGTMELPQYGEDWWPHVWVHKDGWIVVYYPKSEPTSRLMDWGPFKGQIQTTTLKDVMLSVAGKLGADLGQVETNMHYYHWQHPEAKKLLVVLDWTQASSDTFTYTIPAALSVYEVSASHYGYIPSYGGDNWSRMKIDGDIILSGGEGSYTLVGLVPSQYQSRGVTHEVRLEQYISRGCYYNNSNAWIGSALFFLYK